VEVATRTASPALTVIATPGSAVVPLVARPEMRHRHQNSGGKPSCASRNGQVNHRVQTEYAGGP